MPKQTPYTYVCILLQLCQIERRALKQLCYIELEFRSIITLQRLTVLEHFF